ncbi:MAG: sensor histidine kinase [Actinobacteria bacterium]|nr:sensor histidine kinase [Actinomycetota bacterium]
MYLFFAVLMFFFGIFLYVTVRYKASQRKAKELKDNILLVHEERERIARDMHDGLAQSIYSIILGLDVCLRFIDTNVDETKIRLTELRELAAGSLRETRQYIYNLSPNGLSEKGLVSTLEGYFKTFSKVDDVGVDLVVNGDERPLDGEIGKTFYQIAREAVGNAAKHGEAEKIVVSLNFEDESTSLIVEDDGIGFDVEKIFEDLNKDNRKMGLSNIKNRVESCGGACLVDSLPGKGTKIAVKIPT